MTEKQGEYRVRRPTASATPGSDPNVVRPRRLRTSARLRNLAAETYVHPDQLIMPHFVTPAATGRACPACGETA